MEPVAYVNGEFVPESEAKVSVFDRGFLFADGVYEVSTVLDGQLVDNSAHLSRLHRSLSELDMRHPCSDDDIIAAQHQLIERNEVREGVVYLQVTRGAAPRDFSYPKNAKPTLVMFSQSKSIVDSPAATNGIKVISVPDIRWGRRDIKTVGLLAASMAKQQAVEAGVDDAWMTENGEVTEGSSNNAWIITRNGAIVTRPPSNKILKGITRMAVLAVAGEVGYRVEERPFTIAEAQGASEAFVTSASSFVMPVVEIDGKPVGAGVPGAITARLRELYIEFARKHLD